MPFLTRPNRRLFRAQRPIGKRRVEVLFTFLLALTFIVSGESASADVNPNRTLSEHVPVDAVFAYITSSDEGGTQTNALGSIRTLLDGAYGLGLLSGVDAEVRCWLDTLTAYADILTFPHALVLLDIKARPRDDGGHELAGLSMALVIEAGDRRATIDRRIQHLLSTYTNSQETTLTCENTDDRQRCTLTDRRIPDWFVMEWGREADVFIATIGRGSFDAILALRKNPDRSLARDAWHRHALQSTSIPSASTVCHLNMTSLRPALDAPLKVKVDRVLSTLGWGGVDRAVLAFDRKDRFTIVEGAAHRDDKLKPFSLMGPRFVSPSAAGAIPVRATRVAALDVEPRTLLHSVADAYLAARSPRAREGIVQAWRMWQQEAGLSIDGDILEYLDRGIIVHDFPRHAFNLPFARTMLFRVRRDPDMLRQNVDRLMSLVNENPSWISPLSLRRDPDGIWSLFFGINGPALVVTDEWLILSFSPQAVRDALAEIRRSTREPEANARISSVSP